MHKLFSKKSVLKSGFLCSRFWLRNSVAKATKQKFTTGFTLIELIVSVSIIIVITVVVVFNQDDLGDQIALNNVVNDIDVQIREAQTYGISVKEFSSNSNEFNVAYGVDFGFTFRISPPPIGLQMDGGDLFYTFADRTSVNGYNDSFSMSGTCNLGGTSECVMVNRLVRGNRITKLCVIQAGNTELCTPSISHLSISFYRPNPDARILFNANSSNPLGSIYPGFLGARIEVTSPKGKKKSVVVYTTGQIAIQ